jgi:hypothetical protein
LGRALGRLRDDPPLRRRLSENARRQAAAHDWQVVGPQLAGRLPRGRAGRLSTIRV